MSVQALVQRVLAGAVLAVGLATVGPGCASTEYLNEGPGQLSDRAAGVVPEGVLGACRRPDTKRPAIISQALWDRTKACTSRTPATFVRLGIGKKGEDGEVDAMAAKVLDVLKDAKDPEVGKNKLNAVIAQVKAYAIQDDLLKRRVSKQSQLPAACDPTYMLNTMMPERLKLVDGERCTTKIYDPKERSEVCLFDVNEGQHKDDTLWLTSSWDCTARTGAVGEEQSCYRLCAYDDYCIRQVGCASADLDLLLCTMGVCLPEDRAGL